MRLRNLGLCALALAPMISADDVDLRCPLYPASLRLEDQARIARELEYQKYRLQPRIKSAKPADVPASANFIDDYVFGSIATDGVPVANRTTDLEFVRRIMIDLTGHIPTSDQIKSFLADQNPDKRNALIDSLIGSPAYVDRWTQWYGDQFKVGSNYYNIISVTSRNLFYKYVRDMVERDRPYNEFAAQMITATGDSLTNAPANYLARSYQQGDPTQDTFDALTNNITTNFLGVQTQCVSCHDGRRHLEPINLFLLGKRRADFWGQSAFLSQLTFTQESVNAYGSSNRLTFQDSTVGGYSSTVPSNNPGQRPARTGGPYSPTYIFNGAKPSTKNWRSELATTITGDRQFARASVNYIWAKLFTIGIVDPPDNWDMARIDPKNPPDPSTGFGLQPSNPALLEALATEFISSGYSVQHMIRLMVQSNAYQLSSKPPDGWKPLYNSYFAKHLSRRLTAEEVFDAVTIATGTETPMYVEGFDKPLMYATQLPDMVEPRTDGNITYFLSQFGRGDWFNSPRNSTSTILQVLFLMNDNQIMARTLASRDNSRSTRVAQLLATNLSEDDMVMQLFLSTLGRPPTDDERAALQRNRSTRANREDWLSDVQWALLNKLDFLFNY
jgi:Protein of unknown function (DUF1553)/Protein of unknown function (DUF1549)